ncbi:DNA helicase UvrD [Candidatus Pacearchaeota archaeon]|nr:DNA helicase UvrD [Candidatus Pacearchaeota archaeon]
MIEVIADFQIHSRFARATSKDITIDNLEKWAKIKGLDIIGTGDFQHPLWRKEIDEKLKEDDKGILWTEKGFPFLWQTEISLMFSQDGKRRAVHLLVFVPNRKTADAFTKYLLTKGRIDYDGRPIFGMTCENFTKDLKEIDDKIEIIPAHCMTPWFGLFGSKSGFDSLKECFRSQVGKIYAIESGMSADPAMLWRFEEVAENKVNVVSFSDAHSFWPWRIGREATIFEIPELSYDNIIKAIRTGEGLKSTIETPPAYGKYHYDGHRNCNFSSSPEETKKLKGICPVCKKPLIIGVDYRVEEIAKEKKGFKPENAKPFHHIIPLHELISVLHGTPMASRKSWEIYNRMIENFGNEFNILLKVSREEFVRKEIDAKLIDLILKNREGKIKVKPGFDGEYGKVLPGEIQGKLF